MAAPPTPLEPRPFVGFTITLPDPLTVVEVSPPPFNNTKEIIFLNRSTTDAVFVQVVDSGNPSTVPDAGDVTEDNSTVIPAGGSFHVCVCSEGSRVSIADTEWWTANGPGSQFILVLKAESGEAVRVNITYVQNIGGADGRGCGGC